MPDNVDAATWTMDPKVVTLSTVTLAITVFGSVLFRGFMRIIPILIGIISGYVLAYFMQLVEFDGISNVAFFKLPTFTAPEFHWGAIIAIAPAALVVLA